jgi:hypothetical protein
MTNRYALPSRCSTKIPTACSLCASGYGWRLEAKRNPTALPRLRVGAQVLNTRPGRNSAYASSHAGQGGDDSKLKMYCWQRRENVYLGPRKFEIGELGLVLRFDHSRELVTFDICDNARPYTGWLGLWSVAHPVSLGTSVRPNLFCLLGSCSRLNLLCLLRKKRAAQPAVRPEVACPRQGSEI